MFRLNLRLRKVWIVNVNEIKPTRNKTYCINGKRNVSYTQQNKDSFHLWICAGNSSKGTIYNPRERKLGAPTCGGNLKLTKSSSQEKARRRLEGSNCRMPFSCSTKKIAFGVWGHSISLRMTWTGVDPFSRDPIHSSHSGHDYFLAVVSLSNRKLLLTPGFSVVLGTALCVHQQVGCSIISGLQKERSFDFGSIDLTVSTDHFVFVFM